MFVELEKYQRYLNRYVTHIYKHAVEEYGWISEAPNLIAQLTDTAINVNKLKDLEEGNQIPTIFVPGFGVSNVSTAFMRRVLNEKGHNTFPWDVQANQGFNQKHIDITVDQVKCLADRHGTQVNLVGQSLGGCYIRSITNDIPDHVQNAITMGSPINGIEKIHPLTRERYDKVIGFVDASIIHHTEFKDTFINNNPDVPTTSIYSQNDGVVHWSLSQIIESDTSENVEIQASHFAMGFAIETLIILANRLNQHKENWYKWSEHQN